MNTTTLDYIELETKRAPKEKLIKQLDAQAQRLVKMALDPDITFGVTVSPEDEHDIYHSGSKLGTPNLKREQEAWDLLERTLPMLASRELTGNAAKSTIRNILSTFNSQHNLKWACRVINKNLRAGFDIRTFNKVFGEGTIEKFSVQLADTYEGESLKGIWYVQPKLDGNRVILLDGKAWSRNGKEYKAAQHIVQEFEKKY